MGINMASSMSRRRASETSNLMSKACNRKATWNHQEGESQTSAHSFVLSSMVGSLSLPSLSDRLPKTLERPT